MKTVMTAELIKNFDKIMDIVRHGEEVAIFEGKKEKKNIAVLVPFVKYDRTLKRELGILENRASFSLKEDFKITDEQLISP